MKVFYDKDCDPSLIKGKHRGHHRLRQPGPRPRQNLNDSGVEGRGRPAQGRRRGTRPGPA